jgi:hypothetical protein
VTLSTADRANLAVTTTFAAEQAQISKAAERHSEREPKQSSHGFSR